MKDKKGAFQRILKRVKPDNKIFVDLSLDISKEIKSILSQHPNIKTQRDLALALEKEESEISRWLSGLHNITLESISKISAMLDAEIIMTDSRAKEKYCKDSLSIVIYSVKNNKPVIPTTIGRNFATNGLHSETQKLLYNIEATA